MTSEEQLQRWVAGESIHRDVEWLKGGECCPDFSCCKPELLAAPEIRRAFAAADAKTRNGFLAGFLGQMIALAAADKKVAIVDGHEPRGDS